MNLASATYLKPVKINDLRENEAIPGVTEIGLLKPKEPLLWHDLQ